MRIATSSAVAISINGDSITLTFNKWNFERNENDQTISQYCGSDGGEARYQILCLSKYRKILFVRSEKVAMRPHEDRVKFRSIQQPQNTLYESNICINGWECWLFSGPLSHVYKIWVCVALFVLVQPKGWNCIFKKYSQWEGFFQLEVFFGDLNFCPELTIQVDIDRIVTPFYHLR